jgi:hypothetical protein
VAFFGGLPLRFGVVVVAASVAFFGGLPLRFGVVVVAASVAFLGGLPLRFGVVVVAASVVFLAGRPLREVVAGFFFFASFSNSFRLLFFIRTLYSSCLISDSISPIRAINSSYDNFILKVVFGKNRQSPTHIIKSLCLGTD